MRITQQMLVRGALRDLNDSSQILAKLQSQLSSGKAIQTPSDDPFGTERALRFRQEIQALSVCRENMDLSKDWLNAADTTLSKVTDMLVQARAIGMRGADDAIGQEARAALAAQVSEMLGSMLQSANSTSQGHYLFAGYKIDTMPFTGLDASGNATSDPSKIVSVQYNGDDGSIVRELEPGVDMQVNMTGKETWLDPTQPNSVFSAMIALRDGLAAGDGDAVRSALTRIDRCSDLLGEARAVIGAKTQRLDLAADKVDTIVLGLKSLLSKTEDTDMAQAIVNYQQQNAVHQAALQVNARLLPMSLLDYLR
jgi:flagellar hook-associated protein 3 FlgL